MAKTNIPKSCKGIRKYPRPPKKTASKATWDNWYRRCDEVTSLNRGKVTECTQKESLIQKAAKKVEAIRAMGGKFATKKRK